MSPLEIFIVVLVIAWAGGFSMKFAGKLIHFLLIIAVILILIRILS